MQTHPTFREMVTEAIIEMNDPGKNKPVSRYCIKKYMLANYNVSDVYIKKHSKSYFKQLVLSGYLIKIKESFKLSKKAISTPLPIRKNKYIIRKMKNEEQFHVLNSKNYKLVKIFYNRKEALDFCKLGE